MMTEDVNDLMGYYDGEDGPTNEPDVEIEEKPQPNMKPCMDCWFYSRNHEMCRKHNVAKEWTDTCGDFDRFHGDARMRDFWDR